MKTNQENSNVIHERFNRKVWAFKKDFTGALAKWLVKQSPYSVPDNLSECILEFDKKIGEEFSFNSLGMIEIDLSGITETINKILEGIPVIMDLNNSKSGWQNGFPIRGSDDLTPDNDFIDILAVAQNITCEFAEKSDADKWLDYSRKKP